MRVLLVAGLLVASGLLSASNAGAAVITGTETNNPIEYDANSTNALNFAKQVPGRVGQNAPYVLFNSATSNSITLDFYNPSVALAFFEVRIDGIDTGVTPHPIVVGDTIHSGGQSVAANTLLPITRVFAANSMVEIRLALGAERDFDFDWTAFQVTPAPVPEPTSMAIWGLGAFGMACVARRRRKNRVA